MMSFSGLSLSWNVSMQSFSVKKVYLILLPLTVSAEKRQMSNLVRLFCWMMNCLSGLSFCSESFLSEVLKNNRP